LRVLVTRPPVQSERLARRLKAAGFQPLVAPMIEIHSLGEEYRAGILHGLEKIQGSDGVIAISTNAVHCALSVFQESEQSVPEGTRWYAIGDATAKAMKEFQHVSAKRFVLLAGIDGRRKLEDSLAERGASVERIELYRRVPRAPDQTQITEEPDVLTAMSGETLEALVQYMRVHAADSWLSKPLLVPSTRIAKLGFELGYQCVRITENATEDSLIEALSRLASEV